MESDNQDNCTVSDLAKIMMDFCAKACVATETRQIYFDHQLTPLTRALLMEAKKTAKAIGAKSAYIRSGRVVIAKDDTTNIKVDTYEDLVKLQLPPTAHNNVRSQATINSVPKHHKPQKRTRNLQFLSHVNQGSHNQSAVHKMQ